MDHRNRAEPEWAEDIFLGTVVRLSAPRAGDGEILSRWSEDAGYRRRMDTDAPRPRPAHYFEEQDASDDRDGTQFEFRVRTLKDDRLVGFTAVFSIEWPNGNGWMAMGIGDPQDRGRGYGWDALQLTLRFCFDELQLHRLSLDVIEPNEPAVRLYRRAGFVVEGRQRERIRRAGSAYDLLYMGLLARDWIRPGAGQEPVAG